MAQGNFLPEDEAIIRKEFPGPGLHVHDENNPFGMHRHELGERVDGAHTHTPQNPMGEHVHGEFAGMALIDGAHSHEHSGDGWHHHDEDEPTNTTIPQKPMENNNT